MQFSSTQATETTTAGLSKLVLGDEGLSGSDETNEGHNEGVLHFALIFRYKKLLKFIYFIILIIGLPYIGRAYIF